MPLNNYTRLVLATAAGAWAEPSEAREPRESSIGARASTHTEREPRVSHLTKACFRRRALVQTDRERQTRLHVNFCTRHLPKRRAPSVGVPALLAAPATHVPLLFGPTTIPISPPVFALCCAAKACFVQDALGSTLVLVCNESVPEGGIEIRAPRDG